MVAAETLSSDPWAAPVSSVRLEGVSKSFGNVTILPSLDLAIDEGEFVVLLGQSGCGKSTTLRLIAGLEEPSAGRILIGNRDVTFAPPKARDIAMVFQDYALYPHMSVAGNMAFGLRMRGVGRAEAREAVHRAARILGIESLLDRRPRDLSGGQRQRVAIGRAIVREPAVFLFDEPLSNLDAKLRVHMRSELALLHARLGKTTIYVTHDQVEAMTLATRIVVMDGGRIQQDGPPEEVFSRPANLFVAGFIGTPTMNILGGRLETVGTATRIVGDGFAVDVPRSSSLPAATGRVLVGLRPQALRRAEPGERAALSLRVAVAENLGTETVLSGPLDGSAAGPVLSVVLPGLHRSLLGQRIGLTFAPSDMILFDAETGQALRHGI